MNNQELAVDVWKHPLIQEILKRKLAESSVVNRLIVEEIMMEDELEEAKSASQTIAYAMTKYIKSATSEQERLEKMDEFMGKLATEAMLAELIPNWSRKDEDVKKEIIKKAKTFKSRTHTKLQKALSQADSEQEVQQFIDNTARVIDNQVIEPDLQSTDGQPSTDPIDLVLEMLAEAIAAKATEKLVTPVLNKINKVGNALVVGQAATGAATGGATWFTAALTAMGKAAAGEIAQFVAETALQKAIKEMLLKGFRMLPKAEEMENASATLTKVLGEDVWKYIDTEIKAGTANPEKIKSILVNFWDKILKNFIISSASGELGEKLKEWSVELVTFAPGFGEYKIPVGPFLAGQLGLTAEQIAEISAEAAQIAALPEKEEPESEPTDPALSGTIPPIPGEPEPPVEDEIDEPLPVEIEEVREEVNPVVESESVETDVVEAAPVEQPEIDESMIGNMDVFFGQTDKPSFMGQLFLDEQADMLWGLVDNLNTILGKETSAGGGARTKALVEADEPEDPDMIPWTGRSKSSLKQEMAAFADLLRETKRIADAYKEHGGMESADARFDGTRLKEALTGPIRIDENGILGQVQLHCALLIDEIAQILKSHKATVEPIDEALSEEERQNAVQTIREAYNLLSELYVQSLKESLSSGYRQKEPEEEEEIATEATEDVRSAEEVATEMLDIIVKNPGIAQFFPKAFVTSGGNIVTIGRAVERLDDEIKAFSKIMRNLYKTIKEVGIRRAHLTMAGAQLESLAKTIENNFGVPRLIKRSATKIIKQNLSQDQQPFSEEDDVSRAEREPIPLKISDTPEFQKLDQQRKDIVNEFIKFYNQVVYPMEEGVTYQKESNKILVSFAQKLNLRNSQLKKIFKRMGKKDSALFTRVIMEYPDLRKALEKYLGQQEDGEASDKASSRLRDRINKRITEQQIIDSLKPTIERMLQEY